MTCKSQQRKILRTAFLPALLPEGQVAKARLSRAAATARTIGHLLELEAKPVKIVENGKSDRKRDAFESLRRRPRGCPRNDQQKLSLHDEKRGDRNK